MRRTATQFEVLFFQSYIANSRTDKFHSILLISPANQILLLSRVKTSSSFASAHVFPGGNLSVSQDGVIPDPDDADRHVDGPAYRLGAIRECFEESGLLLAKKDGHLVAVEDQERDTARKQIHSGRLKFKDWVEGLGGNVDSGSYSLIISHTIYPLYTDYVYNRWTHTFHSLDHSTKLTKTLYHPNVYILPAPQHLFSILILFDTSTHSRWRSRTHNC